MGKGEEKKQKEKRAKKARVKKAPQPKPPRYKTITHLTTADPLGTVIACVLFRVLVYCNALRAFFVVFYKSSISLL